MIYTECWIPFFGVVEDVDDPMKLGRVRVRVLGYHTENESLIPTESLPWFSSVVSNSAGVNGNGDSPTGYGLKSTVFGYFLDKTYQTGIVVGSLVGMTGGTNDITGLATQNPNHPLYDLRDRNSIKEIQESKPKKEWTEPPYENNSVYPYNQVFESKGGLIREMDSTPGHERIHEYHPSGSYYEIRENGDRVVKVVGNGYEIIMNDKNVNIRGNVNLTVEGNVNEFIKGNCKRVIVGDLTEIVTGDVFQSYGSQRTQIQDQQEINANEIVTRSNNHIVNDSGPEFEQIDITQDKSYDVEIVRAGLDSSGRHQEFDERETINYTPSDYPQDVPPSTYNGEPKETGPSSGNAKDTPILNDCIEIALPIDYGTRLSTNYTIGDLSSRALFPHQIRVQRGLTEQEIVCNLQALAENILEPLRAEFGSFRINSGFRVGNGSSKHNIGCAVDIQEPTWSAKKHLEVAKWIIDNIPFDAILLEHGNSTIPWLHLQFQRSLKKQRGILQTMIGGKFIPGLKLYY